MNAEQSEEEIRRQLLSSRTACSRYVAAANLDEIIGIVRAKEMLVALEAG